jgi:cell division protein FtsW
MFAKETFGNSLHIFSKQLINLVVGSAFAYVVSRTRPSFWIKYSFHINVALTCVLAMTLIPALGLHIKGASRWIKLGAFSFQPSEFLKYSLCLLAIRYFGSYSEMEKKDHLQYLASFLLPLSILMLQPDFGSVVMICIGVFFIGFTSDYPKKRLIATLSVVVVILGFFLVSRPYRIKRMLAFLDPWSNAKSSGFQIVQSFLAFANGGITGAGIGNSTEKLFYLPESYNDFIFSVIGEELGLLGVIMTLALFLMFIYFGFKIASLMINNRMSQLVSVIVFMIGLQAFVNMCVVLGLLPTKGLNLPLISYGGTSLIAHLGAIGIIISCVRENFSIRKFL